VVGVVVVLDVFWVELFLCELWFAVNRFGGGGDSYGENDSVTKMNG
jgi:hypothetical protein